MLNIKYAKLERSLIEQLMVSFILGATRRGTARAYGIHRNTVNRYFLIFQKRIKVEEDKQGRLTGETEVDETYGGGKRRRWGKDMRRDCNLRKWPFPFPFPRKERSDCRGEGKGKRGRGSEGKTCIMVAVERGTGRVVFRVAESLTKRAMVDFCRNHIEPGSVVITDDLKGYCGLQEAGFDHFPVNKAAGDWRQAGTGCHTNTCENRNGALKTYLSRFRGGWSRGREAVERWLADAQWRIRIGHEGKMIQQLKEWFFCRPHSQ